MRILTILAALALAASGAGAAESTTALAALKLLPKAQAKNVARMEAREGTPAPERWHILVHDHEAENGLREYVVAAGEIVASRQVSQFAESLTPEDVIGAEAVKIDSDRAAKLAQQYALANGATVAAIGYELRKDGADAAPLWRVSCFDEAGAELGSISLTAGKGKVVAHDGFPIEPALPRTAKREPLKTQSAPQIATAEPLPETVETPAPEEAAPPQAERRRPGILRRTTGTLRRIIGF